MALDYTVIGQRIKQARLAKNLTQEDLAEKLNVSRQSVTKWESGKSLPNLENIKEISNIFSVSIDLLVGD